MKKFLSIFLAITMLLNMSMVALASSGSTYEQESYIEKQTIQKNGIPILIEKEFRSNGSVTMTISNGESKIVLQGHKVPSFKLAANAAAWEERYEYDTVTYESSTSDIYNLAALASGIASAIPGPHVPATAIATAIFSGLASNDKTVYFVTDTTVTEVRIGGQFYKYEIHKEIHAYKDPWYDSEFADSPWYVDYDSTDPY